MRTWVQFPPSPPQELDASVSKQEPLQALTIGRPFDDYVFSDFSDVCVDALVRRIAAIRREGWRSVTVLDRPSAAAVDGLQWEQTEPLGTTGFDVVGSWGWLRVEVPEAS